MKLTRYYLIALVLVLFSCTNENGRTSIETGYQPGVVITFDDDYIDDWADVHQALKPTGWKATFFVTKFGTLNSSQIGELHTLKDYGHEIAAHGLNHLDARNYIAQHGADAYLETEIYPMMALMDANQLHAESFAYPFGSRNATTDGVLLKEFGMVRGTTYGQLPPSSQNCYYTGNHLVYGLGLDKSYPHFSVPYFLSLLEYARDHNKIVIFYAHRPVEAVNGEYETDYDTLFAICDYVKTNNMRFYRISDLENL
ncbi:polysaccharide deacetylase [Flavobacterium album]|uniref:Polysaccharide deacetylase n=1 Tax=Flavobacterium album TaxID=2175091 RepID=A0A2S1R020_9FLAO|nr:polysaccharide deacetylase family protein [Flavobacterium album]AWH85899.1 polysaccharide deacetylase [Flavobacterium album]